LFSIHIFNGLMNLLDNKVVAEINVVTSASVKTVQVKDKSTANINTELDYFRGNQIIDMCIQKNIKYHIWSSLKQDKTYQQLFGFHVGVVASFGHLIPASLINFFPR
jgi:hypothetical protein